MSDEKLESEHKLLLETIQAMANHELRLDEGDFYIKLARQTLENINKSGKDK